MNEKTYKFWGWENANVSPVTDEYKGINDPKDLYGALSKDWKDQVSGIGDHSGSDIEHAIYIAGLLER